jgi:hypothetical protein
MQTNIAEKQTIDWLKQNGLNDSYFVTTDLLFVQALDFPDFSRHLIMSKMKRRGLYETHQIYGRI